MHRLLCLTLLALAPAAAWAQSAPGASPSGSPSIANPATSVIGWFQAAGGNDHSVQDQPFQLREAELALQSQVDPFARADFILSANRNGLDIEEAYLTWLALPGGGQAKIGKFRADLGKFNRTHYGQQHITFRRLGTSVPTAEFSPAFLHIILGSETLGECHHSRHWMPSASNFSTPPAPGA